MPGILTIREASRERRREIAAFYLQTGYTVPPSDEDRILIAEGDGRIAGALRICSEGGVAVLRGMRVIKELRRTGIGMSLLTAAADALASETCYTLPHDYLESFYAKVGFRKLPIRRAPGFLQERWHEYGRRGLNVIIMIRDGFEASVRGLD